MLRSLFGETRREEQGILRELFQAMEAFAGSLDSSSQNHQNGGDGAGHWQLWTKAFCTSVNELELSISCSEHFQWKVRHHFEDEMDETELEDYYRHVYFFKNAFIRIFSILDKLGYFLNEYYELDTQKVKPRFSYFTVLRQMHETKRHADLEQKLYDLKMKYEEPMGRLRTLRNTEIHWINAELQDDLKQRYIVDFDSQHVENLRRNQTDLQRCYEMVCLTMKTVFVYLKR